MSRTGVSGSTLTTSAVITSAEVNMVPSFRVRGSKRPTFPAPRPPVCIRLVTCQRYCRVQPSSQRGRGSKEPECYPGNECDEEQPNEQGAQINPDTPQPSLGRHISDDAEGLFSGVADRRNYCRQ